MTLAQMKVYFPLYSNYCSTDSELQADMDAALKLMKLYISGLTSDNITEELEMILVYITKKLSFGRKHDDSEFENKPQIIRDYEFAMEQLKRYTSGELIFDDDDDDTTDTAIRLTAKERRFSSGWFTTAYEEDRE
jgi:hypothetical protein